MVVGLDVHKESIVAGVLPSDSDQVALTAKFERTLVTLKIFVERLRSRGVLTFVNEAGPRYALCATPFGRHAES